MSILFLSFKPAVHVKHHGEQQKPYHPFYEWIGMPIEVRKMNSVNPFMWLYYTGNPTYNHCQSCHNNLVIFRGVLLNYQFVAMEGI